MGKVLVQDLAKMLTPNMEMKLHDDRNTVKDIKTVPIDDNFEQILISAERYACRRSTYIVEMTVEYITALLPRLEGSTLCIIQRDILTADSLGMEFDARAWYSLEQAIEKEQRKRENGALRK